MAVTTACGLEGDKGITLDVGDPCGDGIRRLGGLSVSGRTAERRGGGKRATERTR